jgi:hypothetical protein
VLARILLSSLCFLIIGCVYPSQAEPQLDENLKSQFSYFDNSSEPKQDTLNLLMDASPQKPDTQDKTESGKSQCFAFNKSSVQCLH